MAVFTLEENGLYAVEFPDIEGCFTSGDNIEDAIFMAQDALCLTLYNLEQKGSAIPKASNIRDININENQFANYIAVDTDLYHRFYDKKAVKKTLTIPKWLNERAEEENVNFSSILQTALKQHLRIIE
jgi:predicted RNase H-like HicB family nuclease